MLRALVWDVDGTLAETEHGGHRVAFNQAFAEAGLPWHWDEAIYRQLLTTTGGKERMRRWWQHLDPVAAAAPGAGTRIASLHARKTAIYSAMVARGAVQLRPGVARLLHAARADGLLLAVATTTAAENVQALLLATLGPGSPGWFACIGAGDVVAQKKPAPDIYHWVLQRLGLGAADCLALEDSAAGSSAALAAGLPTVVTRSHYSVSDQLPASALLRAVLPDLGSVDLAQLREWHAGAA